MNPLYTKLRFRIVPCSCMCGGRWAWTAQAGDEAPMVLGCVCHSPLTRALRGGAR